MAEYQGKREYLGTVKAILLNETDAAYLIEQEGDQSWIPKSQIASQRISRAPGLPDRIEMSLPAWLIEAKMLFED